MIMKSYIAVVHKDADSDFGVSFPDFPGCVTAAETIEEATELALEALSLHIEGMKEDGEEIPAPSTMPELKPCPQCEAIRKVELVTRKVELVTRKEQVTIKNHEITFTAQLYRCLECNEEFGSMETLGRNLESARETYDQCLKSNDRDRDR